MFMVFSSVFSNEIRYPEGGEKEYSIEPTVENRNITTCRQALNLSRNENFDILTKIYYYYYFYGDNGTVNKTMYQKLWAKKKFNNSLLILIE